MWGRKKSTAVAVGTSNNVSPFISPVAGGDQDDRYMNLAVAARNWQIAFRVTAAILAVSVAVNGHYVMSSKLVPYIVIVDKMGHVLSVGPANRADQIDVDRVVHSEMVDWVEGTRRVVSDQAAQKFFLRKSYARVDANSKAKKQLDAFIKETKPFESSAARTIQATVTYALRRDGKVYEVEWTETLIGPDGSKLGEERWKGVFTYALVTGDSETSIRANGAGFYITDFTWSKVIG